MTRFVERRRRPSSDDLFELMSVLAHDLRTPLTPIKGYAEILRTRKTLSPEKTSEYATIIVEAGARMERSIELLSGISALYGGRAELQRQPVRAVDVVAERLDLWRGRHAGRVFTADTAPDSGVVLVDRGWLGKALDVLADQFVRGVPAPAVVTLGVRVSGDTTTFTVGIAGAKPGEVIAATDRLGRAFVISVSDVCGYPLSDDFAIDVPTG